MQSQVGGLYIHRAVLRPKILPSGYPVPEVQLPQASSSPSLPGGVFHQPLPLLRAGSVSLCVDPQTHHWAGVTQFS